jgi:hypothetical protein
MIYACLWSPSSSILRFPASRQSAANRTPSLSPHRSIQFHRKTVGANTPRSSSHDHASAPAELASLVIQNCRGSLRLLYTLQSSGIHEGSDRPTQEPCYASSKFSILHFTCTAGFTLLVVIFASPDPFKPLLQTSRSAHLYRPLLILLAGILDLFEPESSSQNESKLRICH